MRNALCWITVALLTLQISFLGIDFSEEQNKDFEETSEQNLIFLGGENSGMNGNNTTNSDCDATEWLGMNDGMGGPVWQNGSYYYTSEIVEWPANSGQFWQMTSNGSTNDPPESVGPDSDWVGPCRCSEIGAAGAVVWDSTANYSAWQIVEHDGIYWIAQDAGAPVEEEPGNEGASGAPSDYWVPCYRESPCLTFNGHGGPVWDSATSYSVNDTVEWPANSGQFWQSTTSGPTSEPSLNGKWMGACSCADIGAAGTVVWDSTANYSAWQIVEHNGIYWIAQDTGAPVEEEPGNEGASGASSDFWVPCSDNASETGPCNEVIGVTTEVWSSTTIVNAGDIYEYPANSSVFWLVEDGIGNQTVGAPGVDADAWAPESCQCEDIWTDSGGPSWDATIPYPVNSVVLYTDAAGVQNLYIAWASPGPGDEPSTDPEWRLCGGEEPSGGPCDDFNGQGGPVWSSTTIVSAGEIYEYPANSGEFYMLQSGVYNTTTGEPGKDLTIWTSSEPCDCKDIWGGGGSLVWDSSMTYSAGMMVSYPAGSNDIWMAIVTQTTSGVAPDQPFADGNQWEICGGGEPAGGGPCGSSASVGVWDTLSRVSTGEVYEYPANSGNYYEVTIQGYLDQTVDSPTTNADIWTPVDCPCEEEWVAAGSPVWDASVTYSPNSVVEWPAGSSMLYITSPAPGPGDEPGIDPEWELCSSPEEPADGNPCAGLTVVGVWDSSMNVTSGEIYEYPVNSGMYYQVNAGSPFWNVNAPDIDLDVWSPIDCPCKETWAANGQPVWVQGTAYPGNYVVEWPAGTGNLYIPLEPTGISVSGGEPGIDNHWVLCDGQGGEEPSGNPCAGLTVVGVWDSTLDGPNLTPRDIYEYPANSGIYYQVNSGGASSLSPDNDPVGWSPIDCPCKETWAANGQPVWVQGTAYPGNYVVEWPAGTGNLYIPLEPTGISVGGGEPGIDIHWILCDGPGTNNGGDGPCDGGTSAGVWREATQASIGDIYEYPANSGTYYEVIQVDPNGLISTAPGEDQDYEFWRLYSCPCKDTWVANGQPVWDSSITNYSGNYVVEWPAGSGNLFLSEGGGLSGSVEPGIDGHWIPCEENLDVELEPEKGMSSIPSIGVVLTLIGILSASAFIGRTRIE